jgi:UDP-4-amino-4,6-dideoxy-N-acetyl-beta-L-altrosamine N-acetyltransferase
MRKSSDDRLQAFGGLIQFRDVRLDDKPILLEWRNRPEVARHMYVSRQITAEEHERWFGHSISNPSRKYWVIVFQGQDVGLINLYDISHDHQRAYWALYLHSLEFQGKGIGAFAEFLVLDYAFGELELHKLCCEVLGFNKPAMQIHKRFGFANEGVLRRHVMREDGFHDVYSFGILREEWDVKRDELAANLTAIAERLALRSGTGD